MVFDDSVQFLQQAKTHGIDENCQLEEFVRRQLFHMDGISELLAIVGSLTPRSRSWFENPDCSVYCIYI
jgi:hypothetical protein